MKTRIERLNTPSSHLLPDDVLFIGFAAKNVPLAGHGVFQIVEYERLRCFSIDHITDRIFHFPDYLRWQSAIFLKQVEISLSRFLYNCGVQSSKLESKCTESPTMLDVHCLGGPQPAGALFWMRTNRLRGSFRYRSFKGRTHLSNRLAIFYPWFRTSKSMIRIDPRRIHSLSRTKGSASPHMYCRRLQSLQ
jgi:hypothetical protein